MSAEEKKLWIPIFREPRKCGIIGLIQGGRSIMNNTKLRQCIHYNMSLCGGFFGGYAILNRCEVFGNAQTANMIHLAMDVIGRDVKQIAIRLIACMLYMCGTALTVIIPKYTKWNLHMISIVIDMAAVVMLCFMPEEMNYVVSLYPVFFAMAFQWNVFADICGYVSSTIFSTNNIRQMVISFTKFVCDRKTEDLARGRFYAGVLLFYHIGVAIAYGSSKVIGLHGILVCILPLITALFFVGRESGWFAKQSQVRRLS